MLETLQTVLDQNTLELLTGGALARCGCAAWLATLMPTPGETSGRAYRAVYTLVNFFAANLGRAQNADDAVRKKKKLQ